MNKLLAIILLTFVLAGCNDDRPKVDAAKIQSNIQTLNNASTYDKRIRRAEIVFGNTVVLRGHWPDKARFSGNNVAKGWCQEFTSIRYIHLKQLNGTTVGSSICN